MHIIIAGGGSVGRFIAEQLVGSGHQVTIIDNDIDVVARHDSTIPDVQWVRVNAYSMRKPWRERSRTPPSTPRCGCCQSASDSPPSMTCPFRRLRLRRG